jgi:uncharacterized membrane protein YtjA (UPF0391 family)
MAMLRWSLLLFIVALIASFFGLGGTAGVLNDVAYGVFVATLIAFLVLDILTARSGGVEAIRHTWSKPARSLGPRRGSLPRVSARAPARSTTARVG